MNICFRVICALRAYLSRLSILVLVLVSAVAYADSPTSGSGGGGATVSYWLLALLFAVNIAGVVYMRRWAATVESREDKE